MRLDKKSRIDYKSKLDRNHARKLLSKIIGHESGHDMVFYSKHCRMEAR